MSIFSYARATMEYLPCNFCGGQDFATLSCEGQDGLPLRSTLCKTCGLIAINPRMTKKWYFRYYQNEYRSKTIEHGPSGRNFDFDGLFAEGYRHGLLLSELVKPHLHVSGAILEVGSSAGGVLAGLKESLKRDVCGIEPSEVEARYAEGKGIKTHQYLMEEVDSHVRMPVFAAILCTQSLNHLLDPRFFFSWAHRHLASSGLLILEVMNFRHQLGQAGYYRNAVKIDHPYMFTPEVLKDFVESAGFTLVLLDTDEEHETLLGRNELIDKQNHLPDVHIRLIARKVEQSPFSVLRLHAPSLWSRIALWPSFIYARYLLFYRLKSLLFSQARAKSSARPLPRGE